MRNRIWDLCKALHNPRKAEILFRIWDCENGVAGVGELGEYMSERGVKLSGVSQYLKQLETLGLLMRERDGEHVYYHADLGRAVREVREVAEMIHRRHKDGGSMEFLRAFGVLMNPFRARVANYLQCGGDGSLEMICQAMKCSVHHFARDIRKGVELGMFVREGCRDGVWRLEMPDDEIVRRVVELSPWQSEVRK